MPTSAIDAILILFEHLSGEERNEVHQQLSDQYARNIAGNRSETEQMIAALRTVAAHVDGELSPASYRKVYHRLKEEGTTDLVEFNRVVRHFGSWRRAKEALSLSEITTARRIEARFRFRRVGKVWRYTEETMRDTMGACVAHYGRPPMVSEFEWWRDRELELAQAQGNDALQLPSPHPYRRRYGSWEQALIQFGYTVEQREARLEQP